MKHKLTIDSIQLTRRRVWYVECSCGWQPRSHHPETGVYGRPSHPVALAEGIAHQHEAGVR